MNLIDFAKFKKMVGGGSGGSGFVDVTELPTTGTADTIYRMTEWVEITPQLYVIDKGNKYTVEEYMATVQNFKGPVITYLVETFPSKMEKYGSSCPLYVLKETGVAYVSTLGTPQSVQTFDTMMGFQTRGWVDDIDSVDPSASNTRGCYSVHVYAPVYTFYLYINGEWICYDSAPPKVHEKSIAANGTYIPDSGFDGISKVTVQVGDSVNAIQQMLTVKQNDASYMFYKFKGDSVGTLLDGVDFSNVTTTTYMFSEATKLTEAPMLDMSNNGVMAYMFQNCGKLKSVPLYNTANVNHMSQTFYGCSSLESIPAFNTSNLKYLSYTFSGCSKLKTIPLLDTKKVDEMGGLFNGCTMLEHVPALDLRAITTASRVNKMFYNCSALTECWIRNIKVDLQVGSGTSYGHLLTLESLLSLCKECHNMGASRTLTIGSANLAKLADVYVKLVDVTDAMRAEDDLIDAKSPFVVCESTDEGAMLITNYMTTKQWKLA